MGIGTASPNEAVHAASVDFRSYPDCAFQVVSAEQIRQNLISGFKRSVGIFVVVPVIRGDGIESEKIISPACD